jgi:acyl dehydratase
MMPVLTRARHLVQQRSMLAAIGRVAADSVRERWASNGPASFALPGPEVSRRVPAPSSALIEDFLSHVGADRTVHAGLVPPALFPQWGMPLALRALRGFGYPLIEMINGGCRLETNLALHRNQDLLVRSRLISVEDDTRRRVLRQRVVTEQEGIPNAMVADVYGILRSRPKGEARSGERPRELLPESARRLDVWTLDRNAGLDFALLTGDVNPLHWLPPYARMMGFQGTILHGFGAMARAHAGLERAFAPRRLRWLDVRFVRPILLPARVALYVEGDRVFVGEAGDAPHLTGTFALA